MCVCVCVCVCVCGNELSIWYVVYGSCSGWVQQGTVGLVGVAKACVR